MVWMNGLPVVVILVMDFDALDGRVTRYRDPRNLTPIRITGGLVSSFAMDFYPLDGRADWCYDPRDGPDAYKRAAGYRPSRRTSISCIVGWPGVVPRDGL